LPDVPFNGTFAMIVSFSHMGLERFFKTGSKSGIQVKHSAKLRIILEHLNTAANIGDINFPNSGLHQLKGSKKGLWALKVNGNWRITFKFENANVSIVDYVDYH